MKKLAPSLMPGPGTILRERTDADRRIWRTRRERTQARQDYLGRTKHGDRLADRTPGSSWSVDSSEGLRTRAQKKLRDLKIQTRRFEEDLERQTHSRRKIQANIDRNTRLSQLSRKRRRAKSSDTEPQAGRAATPAPSAPAGPLTARARKAKREKMVR